MVCSVFFRPLSCQTEAGNQSIFRERESNRNPDHSIFFFFTALEVSKSPKYFNWSPGGVRRSTQSFSTGIVKYPTSSSTHSPFSESPLLFACYSPEWKGKLRNFQFPHYFKRTSFSSESVAETLFHTKLMVILQLSTCTSMASSPIANQWSCKFNPPPTLLETEAANYATKQKSFVLSTSLANCHGD